jgi:pilus assembly protein Flp/PilA
MTMIEFLKELLRDEEGPTSVEYAVMLALIVAACVGAVQTMANATADSFDTSAQELDGVLG